MFRNPTGETEPGLDLLGSQGTVVPDELRADLRSHPAIEGELRLCLAVLQDAVETFQKYAAAVTGRERRLFREAEEWLMEPDTGAALSFEYVGEALGFDTDGIRSRLQRWRERHLARRYDAGAAPQVSRAELQTWRRAREG
jgi:hypothetical protein